MKRKIYSDVMVTLMLALNASPLRGFLPIYDLAEVGTSPAKATVDQSRESWLPEPSKEPCNDGGSSE